MTKISIIIPIYNVEKYLAKCLDSVVNQTFKDIEIICVNDGSTDSSLEILEDYTKKDNRIQIINKKNGGISSARNAGLDVANSEYCYFIDSDDWIELDTIEKLVDIMTKNDVDVVIHSVNNIPENYLNIDVVNLRQRWFDAYSKSDGVYTIPIEINSTMASVAWNKLYKMRIINKYHCRFPEGLINEDELFLWEYMIHCKNFYYLNDVLYNYLSRSNSIMEIRNNSPHVLDILEIQKEVYKIVAKYKNINDYRKYLTNEYIKFSIDLYSRMPKKYRKEAYKKIKEYYETINNDDKIIKTYKKNKMKHFIQCIFSIKNENNKKVIRFFGIKIKFNKSKLKIITTKIVKDKIVFNNFNGKGYGCNPKYIAEEIIRQNLPYELVWLVKDVENVKNEFPKEIKLVEYTTDNAIKELASAKVWISNQRMPELYEKGLFKKKKQYYIQTWHGWTPIKQIEKDVEKEKPWWCKWAKVDSKYMDLLITSCKFDRNRKSKCFYYNGEISDVGLPRNDILYYPKNEKQYIIDKIYNTFSIPKDNKILLYAPTFRDNERLDCYNIDILSCANVLEQKCNQKFTVLVRLHPNVKQSAKEIFDFENYIDVSKYPDVMELLVSADLLITDYSNIMFDFMLMRKPVFLYASDFKKYVKERNFYIDIKQLFFPLAQTNDELIQNIRDFKLEKYLLNAEHFIKNLGTSENGKASKYIVSKIMERIS